MSRKENFDVKDEFNGEEEEDNVWELNATSSSSWELPSPLSRKRRRNDFEKPDTNGKVPKRKTLFSVEEKKKLARAIEMQVPIWKVDDKRHNNVNIVAAAWKKVAQSIGKEVNLCKVVWKSMRDSMRYRIRKENDASCDGEEGNPIFEEPWEFEECMSFWKAARPSQSTTTSSRDVMSPQLDFVEAENINCPLNQQYSIVNLDADKQPDDISMLSEGLWELLNARKNENKRPTEKTGPKKLKYYSMFLNLDRMFQKLPEEIVENLNMAYISQAYAELQKLNFSK